MRKLLRLGAALMGMCVSQGYAHDFWLEADQYAAVKGETIEVSFLVGHGGERDQWRLTPDRIAQFWLVNDQGVKDLTERAIAAAREEPKRISAPIRDSGPHIIAFESGPSFSNLPKEKFLAYARNEGLARVLEVASDYSDVSGTERYSRRAKLLLRGASSESDLYTKAIGQTLEIVPRVNPFTIEAGEPLRLQVFFQGAPLVGAKISLESVTVPVIGEIAQETDEAGEAAFAVTPHGVWRANVIWSEPSQYDDGADNAAAFETIFSSLTVAF